MLMIPHDDQAPLVHSCMCAGKVIRARFRQAVIVPAKVASDAIRTGRRIL